MNKWSGPASGGELPEQNTVPIWISEGGELHCETYAIPRGEMPKVREMHVLDSRGVVRTVRFDDES